MPIKLVREKRPMQLTLSPELAPAVGHAWTCFLAKVGRQGDCMSLSIVRQRPTLSTTDPGLTECE
jgi:hypothetical protein